MVKFNVDRIGIEKSLNCVKQLTKEYWHKLLKIDWNLLAALKQNVCIALFGIAWLGIDMLEELLAYLVQ